ncbi:MAG: protein kinase [Thermomicrobiales bacterium]
MNDDRTPDEPEVAEQPAASEPDAAESGASAGDPRTTIAGRYEVNLQAEPADAGIALAYLGRDLRSRGAVTVKTLRPEYRDDHEMRARFRREARLLQFLSHPNVVRALTYTEERGAPWLILERVPGNTLRDEITAGAPYRPEEVAPALQGLAAGLDHLHARGLVHLDLRPENVMVLPDRSVKLIDFGLAQTGGAAPEITFSGDPSYAAPEQLNGQPIEVTTDVYALGCVVYEMLTGQPPFIASGNADPIRARLEVMPAPPSDVRPDLDLPAWVDEVVLGALEKEPQLRYGSAGLFAGLFRAGVEGEVDVETGRPNPAPTAAGGRHFPVNEPAIAVKGSRRLARRRSELDEPGDELDDGIIEAAVVPAEAPVRARRSRLLPSGPDGRINFAVLERRLWQACAIALVLNLLLLGALAATRGLPFSAPTFGMNQAAIGPGSTVRIAGTGLVARSEPRADSPIAAALPDGGTVRISGAAVAGDSGDWWPVEITTDAGTVQGYVPQSWVQP